MARLDSELIADPAKLIATGWKPTDDAAQAVQLLAKDLLGNA